MKKYLKIFTGWVLRNSKYCISLLEKPPSILHYHRIASKSKSAGNELSVSKENFRKQILYLKDCFSIVSLDTICDIYEKEKHIPKDMIAITFDDGYKDLFDNALPILKENNIPATIFLSTSYIETSHLLWWDELPFLLDGLNLQALEYMPLLREALLKKIRAYVKKRTSENYP